MGDSAANTPWIKPRCPGRRRPRLTTNQHTITGPNSDPMRWVPRAWTTNRRGQDDGRQRHDQTGQARIWQLEALNRGEHGDGRRDHRVAVEQTGPDQADDGDNSCRPGPGPQGF